MKNFKKPVAAILCLTTVLPFISAHAQTVTQGGFSQMISANTRLASTADDVSDGGNGAQTQGDLNDASNINNVLGNIAVSSGQAQDGQTAMFTDAQFQDLMTFLNTTTGNLTATLNDTAHGALHEYSRTNDVLEKLTDPRHTFVLAAATAAGGVIGAAVSKLVLQGLTQGAKQLFRLVSGEHRREKIARQIQIFNEARESYEKLSQSSKDLEVSFGSISHAIELSQKLGLDHKNASKIQSQIGPEIEQIHVRYQLAGDQLRAGIIAGDDAKIEVAKQTAAELARIETFLKTIQTRLGELGTFCSNVDTSFSRVRELEGLLQQTRIALIASELEWREGTYSRFRKDLVQQLEVAKRERRLKRMGRMDEREIKRLSKVDERNIERLRKAVSSDCRELAHKHDLKTVTSFTIRKTCKGLLYGTHSDSEIGALFLGPPAGLAADVAALDLTQRVEQVRRMEQEHDGKISDLRDTALDHLETGKVLNPQMVAEVGAVIDQMTAMIRFIDRIKNEQVHIVTDRLAAQRESLQSFCKSR